MRRVKEAVVPYHGQERGPLPRGRRPMSHAARKQVTVPHGTELPPPRPGVRYVRVPLWGIVIADDELRRRVDDRFHWPMIILALAILPLFLIERHQRAPKAQRHGGVDRVAAPQAMPRRDVSGLLGQFFVHRHRYSEAAH